MDTMTLTASRKPNKKETEEYRQFLRSNRIGRLVVKIKHPDGTDDEDVVLEIEQKDAEGRTLLQDG